MWMAVASSAIVILGIAPSQVLLGLSLAALLLSGDPLRLPPIKLPLALFLLGTVIALLFSGDPAAGLPQIRKFYVFAQLLVVFSLVRRLAVVRGLVMAWMALASVSAILSFVQFARKVQQAHAAGRDFYSYYVGERITGFMSHWYTFSVLAMFALLMAAAYLFFARPWRYAWLCVLPCAAIITLGIILAETRAIWIATAVAGCYLLWFWRRWVLAVVPLVAIVGFFIVPSAVRTRLTSIVHPGKLDSNEFRVVCARTGLRMIEAHPLLGLGPEEPRIQFDRYVPSDIPRPLPDGSYIHLHNIYLEYAAERGVPVLLIFFWLIGKILYDFWRGLGRLPPGPDDRRALLHGGIAVVIAMLIEGFADVPLGDSEVLAMFLAIVGCAYVALLAEPAAELKQPVKLAA